MSYAVTLFITSCGRPELLKRTLTSFVAHNTYPIQEVILCEDSGIPGIVDFASDILPYPITYCYNTVRSGQMKTIEKYTPLIKTPYVFHLEDDYEFFDYGFIELSFKYINIHGYWKNDATNLKNENFYYKNNNLEEIMLVTTNPEYYRQIEKNISYGNSQKIRNELGWAPKIKFIDLVNKMMINDINIFLSNNKK
jgi:hypothetical protein